MTEVQVPRSDGLPAGVPQSGVTQHQYNFCLDILLNRTNLEEHLKTENPDPSPTQLIAVFLQQVDNKIQDAISGVKEIYKDPKDQTVERFEEAKSSVERTKKVKGLRLLALKVASHLKWNLSALEKNLSVPTLYKLMSLLLVTALEGGLETARKSNIDIAALPRHAAFALHLFHRWCLRCVVKDSFPQRPARQNFLSVSGQPDTNFHQAQECIRMMKEEMEKSLQIMEKFLEANLELQLPTMDCFMVPTHEMDEMIDWEACRTIPPEEVACQTSYSLGFVYFHKMDYSKAFEMFKRVKELYGKFTDPVFCHIDGERLRGYLVSCSSLFGVVMDEHPQTLYEKAETCRKHNYQGIVDVFLEDNEKQELSMDYRTNVEAEINKQGPGYASTSMQVCLANVVRGVMEGKALISPLQAMLEGGDSQIVNFLIKALTGATKSANATQRSNLKCFVSHLAHLVPPEMDMVKTLMRTEMASAFSREERAELEDMEDEDDLFLSEVLSQDSTLLSTCPVSREGSYNVSDVESQLLTVYDPATIRELVMDLCQNRTMHTAHIIGLNDKWKVPREIRHNLEMLPMTMNSGFQHAFTYVLIGKARHCMDIKIFERARQLLDVADSVVHEVSYPLSKHIRWQCLLVDLLQFSFNQTLSQACTLQDLVKKAKTCLTIVRLGQDIQPNWEVTEHCAAFLLNVSDWEYLSSLDNAGNSYIELSRMIGVVMKDLANKKNARKPARELWDRVLPVFQSNTQHKRTSSGRDSALHRDSQLGVMPRDAFLTYLLKLKEPSVVTLFLSLLTKLFTSLKDDVSSEITNEFSSLWPLTVNSSPGMAQAVSDMLTSVMSHALKVNPSHPTWLIVQADIYYALNDYSSAMKFYLEAGVVSTDFFTILPSEKLFDDALYRKMIKCCTYLNCFTQVAVLCQFLREVDYATAFKCLQEKTSYDAMDAYYSCLWDSAMLEYLVHMHTRRGELDKKQSAMRALTMMDVSQNNPEEIRKRAIHIRKTKFLRALAKQYIV